MLQIKGPGQVMHCLGCLVSMAGALGGAVPCGQRLAGVPGEERVPVLRLRGAVKTVGGAAAEPAVILHKAGLLLLHEYAGEHRLRGSQGRLQADSAQGVVASRLACEGVVQLCRGRRGPHGDASWPMSCAGT